MRKRLIAGNWKMNKLAADVPAFFNAFKGDPSASVEVLFAAPFTLLAKAAELARPRGIQIASQNIHWEPAGAFTGDISIAQVKETGATATLIGHSERRQYFGETDVTVAKKTKAALAAGLMPIVCVGELLAEREANETEAVVARQMQAVLDALPAADAARDLVIAYEPVWAIGTGRSATTQQAQDVHRFIRGLVTERLGPSFANALRILYGGSATPANIAELLTQKDIDGGLVGGASLKPDDFTLMVQKANSPAP